jgi:hypothetical protein
MRPAVMLVSLLACLVSLEAGAEGGLPFDFWPLPGARSDPRFVEMRDGACGPVAVARVHLIPPANDQAFESEVVFQLSSHSRIVRRWRVPANTIPLGVVGAELVFSDLPSSSIYKVSTAGAVSRFEPGTLPETTETQCRMPKVLQDSAYARCWSVPRIGGSGQATLALQGPCT